jgi:DMSO reductase anchor subunit
LTQEGILAPIVGFFLFLQFLNDRVVDFGTNILTALQLFGFISAVLFIWRTGLVYKLKTRPAWDTPLVTVNFFMSTFAIGSMALYLWAYLRNEQITPVFFAASLLLLAAMFISQLLYVYRSSTLMYGVAISPVSEEFRPVLSWWSIIGIGGTTLVAVIVFFNGHSGLAAILLLFLNLVSLAIWRAYFFMAGKAVVYFPMYKHQMDTNF